MSAAARLRRGGKTALTALLAAAALLASPPAAAADDQFCPTLRRIADGADETPAFASLAGADLGALLGGYCRMPVPASSATLCTRSLLPREITLASLSERIQTCLPDAQVSQGEFRQRRVRHGRLRMAIDESGGERAHVGRIITLYFEADAPEHAEP